MVTLICVMELKGHSDKAAEPFVRDCAKLSSVTSSLDHIHQDLPCHARCVISPVFSLTFVLSANSEQSVLPTSFLLLSSPLCTIFHIAPESFFMLPFTLSLPPDLSSPLSLPPTLVAVSTAAWIHIGLLCLLLASGLTV